MSNPNESQVEERVRSQAAELASKIRFLREELLQGKGDKQELRKKIEEVNSLFKIEPDIATINLEIFDTVEKSGINALGRVSTNNCLRIVEVGNLNHSEGANGVKTISLLPSFRSNRANLEVYTSPVLPPGLGGL